MNKFSDMWTCLPPVVPYFCAYADVLYNPIYPCHIKWRCKASRKKFRK